MIDVFVPAISAETLHPRGYLLANADLIAAKVDPAAHFRQFGHRENRQQINGALLESSAYRKAKFERFKDMLDFELDKQATFPISVGSDHFSIDQYQMESANGDFQPFIDEVDRNPGKRYLDLGCGLRRQVRDNCLYLEVYPSITADLIVGTDCTYPIKSATLDGIGCFAVLEHTRRPWQVVAEIDRMLKPGGRAFIDWPFLQPVHGYPSHYFNATREGLKSVFEDRGYKLDLAGTLNFQGPDYTMSWAFGDFVRSLPEAKRQAVERMTVGELLKERPESRFWRELLNGLPDEVIERYACGNSLIATKSL